MNASGNPTIHPPPSAFVREAPTCDRELHHRATNMARFPRFRFLALAVVFHLIYIASIFDIYFVSPIVSGMRLFKVERPASSKAPADRLVLFVGTRSSGPLFQDAAMTHIICY